MRGEFARFRSRFAFASLYASDEAFQRALMRLYVRHYRPAFAETRDTADAEDHEGYIAALDRLARSYGLDRWPYGLELVTRWCANRALGRRIGRKPSGFAHLATAAYFLPPEPEVVSRIHHPLDEDYQAARKRLRNEDDAALSGFRGRHVEGDGRVPANAERDLRWLFDRVRHGRQIRELAGRPEDTEMIQRATARMARTIGVRLA